MRSEESVYPSSGANMKRNKGSRKYPLRRIYANSLNGLRPGVKKAMKLTQTRQQDHFPRANLALRNIPVARYIESELLGKVSDHSYPMAHAVFGDAGSV